MSRLARLVVLPLAAAAALYAPRAAARSLSNTVHFSVLAVSITSSFTCPSAGVADEAA